MAKTKSGKATESAKSTKTAKPSKLDKSIGEMQKEFEKIWNALLVSEKDKRDYVFVDISNRTCEEELTEVAKKNSIFLSQSAKVSETFLKKMETEIATFFQSAEKNIKNNDKQNFTQQLFYSFAYLFVVYTLARRESRKKLLNRYTFENDNNCSYSVKGKFSSTIQDLIETHKYEAFASWNGFFLHMEYMAEAIIEGPSEELIDKTHALCRDYPSQQGYANHFGELVANFYSLHLEKLFVAYDEDEVKDKKIKFHDVDKSLNKVLFHYKKMIEPRVIFGLKKMHDIVLEGKGKKNSGPNEVTKEEHSYAKFHLNYGRLLALVGKADEARMQIMEAINGIKDSPTRASTLARYEDYLREIVSIRAFLDMKMEFLTVSEAQEQLKSEKITNIAYVSIFSALVGFVTATLSSMAQVSSLTHLALLISLVAFAFGFVISLILLFILLVNRKRVKSNKGAYAIVAMSLSVCLISFVVILVLSFFMPSSPLEAEALSFILLGAK